jgi:endonuclease YncB( thermonuclease family)
MNIEFQLTELSMGILSIAGLIWVIISKYTNVSDLLESMHQKLVQEIWKKKKRGLIAKEWLINKIDPTSVGSAKEIMLKSYEYGKYGRVIGELFIVSGSRKQSINKMMLAEGLVTEYDGGAR